MSEKRCVSLEYLLVIGCIMLYFIPKYLEYTTFCQLPSMGSLISLLKALSYLFAITILSAKFYLTKKYSGKLLAVITPLAAYFVFQAGILHHNTIFVLLLLSAILKEKYFNQYVIRVLRLSCALYVITVVASKLGIIENVITSRNKFGGLWTAGGNGFEYSGQMMMMLIPIVFLYYYKHDGKIKLIDNVFWVIIACLVYSSSKTIMGFVLIIAFIVIYNVGRRSKKFRSWMTKSKLVRICPAIFAMISVGCIWMYNMGKKFAQSLDIIVNGRLSVASRVIKSYSVKLMGTNFQNNTLNGRYEILDSEYVHMLVAEGILYLLLALFLCYCIMRYAQRRSWVMTLIWTMIFANAIFNNGIFGLVMNPFSVLLVPAIKDAVIAPSTRIILDRYEGNRVIKMYMRKGKAS